MAVHDSSLECGEERPRKSKTDTVYKRQELPKTTYDNATGLYETAGYVTKDDFGSEGDNTIHYNQGYYSSPHYVAANVSTANITDNSTLVDVYVTSFFAAAAAKYLQGNTTDWINITDSTGGAFTSYATIPKYAELFWSKDC